MIKIIIHGYGGKMGTVIREIASEGKEYQVVAGIDVTNSENVLDFPTFTNIFDCDAKADVIIDFSNPAAVPNLLDYARTKKIPLVLCTTGLSEDVVCKILETSKKIPIFLSANMSIGINLLHSILESYTKILSDTNFDIEILEAHHNKKVDAPSGTALYLADVINNQLEEDMSYTFERASNHEKRKKNEIGIHSVRGGSIVGEHTVIFAGDDEVIEFTHKAYSKKIFAVGALKAAKFLLNREAKLYSMDDLVKEKI